MWENIVLVFLKPLLVLVLLVNLFCSLFFDKFRYNFVMNKNISLLPTDLMEELGIKEIDDSSDETNSTEETNSIEEINAIVDAGATEDTDSSEEVKLPKKLKDPLSSIKETIIVPFDYFEKKIEPELKKVFDFIHQHNLLYLGYGLYNSKNYKLLDPQMYSYEKYPTSKKFEMSVFYSFLENKINVFSVDVSIGPKTDVNTLLMKLNESIKKEGKPIAKAYEHFEDKFDFLFFKYRLLTQLNSLKLPN